MEHDEHDNFFGGDLEQFVTTGEFDEQPSDDVGHFGATSVESLDFASEVSDRFDGISEVVPINILDTSSNTFAENSGCSSINFSEVLLAASQTLPVDTVKPIWE